jgi:glycosyltransferase involved in cell wall biosynthesis
VRSLTYFYRSPGELVSIEKVFAGPSAELSKNFIVSKFVCRFRGASPLKVLANMLGAYIWSADINHVTGDVNYLCLALPRRNLVLTIHDFGELERFNGLKRWIYRKLWYDWPMRRAANVTFVSNFTRASAVSEFPFVLEKSRVIHNSIGTQFSFKPKLALNDEPKLLVVGAKPNKNIRRLIGSVRDMRCQLRIIGRIDIAEQLLLDRFCVKYTNSFDLTDLQMAAEYHDADILVFPSLYEGFGLPIIEAQASGCPVVTSMREPMVEVGGTGAHYIDPTDEGSIRNGIQRVLADDDYRGQLIRQGYDNSRRFTIEFIAGKWRALYREMYSV